MSEYTHNDDVADLLYETQATWLEEREQMIARLGEVYASWLASNAELNDAKAEIARLASELKVKEELIRYLVKYYLDIGARRDMETCGREVEANLTIKEALRIIGGLLEAVTEAQAYQTMRANQ